MSDLQVLSTENSACFYNSITNTAACTGYWNAHAIIQHHNVEDMIACKNHYCVRSYDTTICSGAILTTLAGNHEYNPLTSDPSQTVEPQVFPADRLYNGYNLVLSRFQQNVITKYEHPVTDITCDGFYGTCVTHGDKKTCFGIPKDAVLHNDLESFLIGMVIQMALYFAINLIIRFLTRNRPNATYFCLIVLGAPVAFIFSSIIINFAVEFFMSFYMFVIGCGIGLLAGDMLARFVFNMFFREKRVIDEELEEQIKALTGDDEDDNEDEKGEVEIELNSTTRV